MKILFLLIAVFFSQVCFAENIIVYTRTGCPHCEEAHQFFDSWKEKNPEHIVTFKNVWEQEEAMQELKEFAKAQQIDRLAVPLLRVGNRYHVGFPGHEQMNLILNELLAGGEHENFVIDLPILGKLDTHRYGIFALTVILGLIDGVNPCAMWVLLILLSLLVHLKDRKKMLAISGVFVVVSGVVYFLFMSSWLLFYDYVDFGRPMQIGVAIIALLIGLVHIKDFFLLGKGISFSIPSSLKPKIIMKVRDIIQARSIFAAIASVVGLAIFVNFIELMCTAGIPSVYTKILKDYGIVGFERIFYLATYCLFYMLDDSIMVGAAVWTLSSVKLQESGGVWLKLLSGITLTMLAMVLIFFPQLLS